MLKADSNLLLPENASSVLSQRHLESYRENRVDSDCSKSSGLLDTGCGSFNVTYLINPTKKTSHCLHPIRAMLRIDSDIEYAFFEQSRKCSVRSGPSPVDFLEFAVLPAQNRENVCESVII